MIRREYRVYERMQGIAGVPVCYGLKDGEHLMLEYVEGRSLREAQCELRDRDAFFKSLLELILTLHGVGVAHADMKRKDNILVTPDERPYLIDFGTAVLRHVDGGFLNRFIFGQACRIDLNAWVKLKYQRRSSEIAGPDRAYYRPTAVERVARLFRRGYRKLTARHWRKARRRTSAD